MQRHLAALPSMSMDVSQDFKILAIRDFVKFWRNVDAIPRACSNLGLSRLSRIIQISQSELHVNERMSQISLPQQDTSLYLE